jgi:hypothetical protein
MSEVDCLRKRVRIVVRGKEADGVTNAGNGSILFQTK